MEKLSVLYTALSVFGAGVTIIDFLGVLDHAGADNGDAPDGGAAGHEGADGADSTAEGHDGDSPADHHGSYLSPGHSGLRAMTVIMSILRTAVYFSLGFGLTGLFSGFRGLSPASGLRWAIGAGLAIAVIAWLLRRFIRHDLDSSIGSDEFLMETGTLLLPLEGDSISKITVKRFGKETELYVKSRDANVKLPKGKTVRIIEYDNEVYWVEPAE